MTREGEDKEVIFWVYCIRGKKVFYRFFDTLISDQFDNNFIIPYYHIYNIIIIFNKRINKLL